MPNNKEYYLNDFLIHENENERNPLENESKIYIAVSEGDLDTVKNLCRVHVFTQTKGVGILSDNNVRNLKYHFVIATAMISRFCIKNGMIQDTSYSISDYYIRKMDLLTTLDEIDSLHTEMCLDYCERMLNIRKQNVISRSIVRTLDYINNHIHSQISLDELAENAGLSSSYLSRLFSKEVHMSVHEYINRIKIEKARNLLCYSDYSISDISNYLAFSSESHFISIFKKYERITPAKYRNEHFRESWNTSHGSILDTLT